MRSVKIVLLVSLCLQYSFIAQASYWDSFASWFNAAKPEPVENDSLPEYGKGKVDIEAYQRSLSSWDDFKSKSTYDDVDQVHKHLTDEYRKRGIRWHINASRPGQSATVNFNDKKINKKINVHKPTLDEREIMLTVLRSRKYLPQSPEKIVDLIYIVDSDIGSVAGFFSLAYDRIFLARSLFSSPSELLHVIMHEYTHYEYFFGHYVGAAAKRKEIVGGSLKKLSYDPIAEEIRADNHAVKIVDCAGCGGEYRIVGFSKDTPVSYKDREAKAYAKKTGYTALYLYNNQDSLSGMSRKFCSNCLQSRKNRLVKTPAEKSKIKSAVDQIASRTDEEMNDITDVKVGPEYYDVADEWLY